MSHSVLPAAAAAASWMDSLKMSMREIRQRFTKSEIFLMGWRSQEQSANLHKKMQASNHGQVADDSAVRALGVASTLPGPVSYAQDDHTLQVLEERLEPIAYKLTNEKGEVDLRKLTGNEAMTFLSAMGIRGITNMGVR